VNTVNDELFNISLDFNLTGRIADSGFDIMTNKKYLLNILISLHKLLEKRVVMFYKPSGDF
jgi:hypothetical protein